MAPSFNLKEAIVEALTASGVTGTASEVRQYIKSKFGKDWKDIETIMDDLCVESKSSFFPPEDRVLKRIEQGKYSLKEAGASEPSEIEVETERPKPSAGDAVHTAARVGLSLVPVVGGAAKEIFNAIVAPPLAKRQAEWIESVIEKLRELEEKVEGFRIENLAKNANFITTVTYATIIAIRNHQEEKLEALRNAVLNTALSPLVEEDLMHMFLNFIDELTPWHLRLLKYFDNPEGWLKQNEIPTPSFHMGGPISIMNVAFPELEKDSEFAGQLIRDLHTRGLISADITTMKTMTSKTGMYSPRTTPLGKQFLRFIISPITK